jgi:spermidine/putrescine transport system permease protein
MSRPLAPVPEFLEPPEPASERSTPARKGRRVRERHGPAHYILPAWTGLVILWTIVPIIVMVVYSFNKSPNQRETFHWYGFTTYWYRHVFQIPDLTHALVNSLVVASVSTAIATLIGVPMAMALARHRFLGRGAIDATVFVDIAAPSVVVGASLLALFLTLNIDRGLVTIIIAHVAFNVAFVIIVVRARIVGLDRSIERAAADLGAGPWTTFQKVLLPLMLPGILAGAMLCFAMSIDDFIITEFVAGQTLTFPLWVYGSVKVGIPPQVFVMGTMIFVFGIALALVNSFVARRTARSEAAAMRIAAAAAAAGA